MKEDRGTMLGRHDPSSIERALDETSSSLPFPPASDRAAWDEVREVIGNGRVSELVARAEANARTDVPGLPATLYLEFSRAGSREGYERPANRRRQMLSNLVLAECLEAEGRFLDPLLDVAWAICEESSWSWPAHQGDLADMGYHIIDLSAAMTALYLAELDLLLGDRLDPALAKRIRHEVDWRCLTPYLTRHDHWWLFDAPDRPVNNWTAVCNAGVAGAAIHLEPDAARLAEILARAARSLDDYLATFDEDGGSSEGPAYWSYGFGYYTVLAHLVGHRTHWKVDFFEGEHVRRIARFPSLTQLSPGLYVNFSDCDQHVGFVPAHLSYLSRRLDLLDLARLAREQPGGERDGELTWGLRDLFWRPDPVEGRFVPARHDWFGGMMWMVSREDPEDPGALALAAKGGHNGEMHNQNDVGNLIVHAGGESVIADIGRGRYTKAYFGPERYEHIVNSSLGHSVPVPNGQEQLPGDEHGAMLLEHRADDTADLVAFELRDAYPPGADLDSLMRTVVLRRGPPCARVELTDAVRFTTGPGSFESVLITFGVAEVYPDSVLLRGVRGALRVYFDSEAVVPRVEVVEGVDLAEGPVDVRRVVFALPGAAQEGSVHLRIEPEDRSAASDPR